MQDKDFPQLAVFLLLFTIAMIVTIIIWQRPAYIVLLLASGVVAGSAYCRGATGKALGRMFISGVLQARPVLVIVSLVGMLTGVWKAGGIIPALMHLSLGLIRPQGFLVTTFLLTALAAMLLGTATGIFSTIGIVLAGVGSVLAIPYPAVVGAIVSGAFVGDRSSPVSSTVRLVTAMTEADQHSFLRHLWTTGVPAVLVSALAYLALDRVYASEAVDLAVVNELSRLIQGHFELNGWLFLPPILMALLALARIPAQRNVFLVLLLSAAVAKIGQGLTMGQIGAAAIWGYHTAGPAATARLVDGGGFLALVPILVTLCAATGFNGLLEGLGLTELILGRLLAGVREPVKLLKYTMAVSAATAMITSNQAVSIVIPARMLREKVVEAGATELALARAIAGAGGVLAAVIPWSTAALTPALILGTKVYAFAPFAFYCWLQPLVEFVFIDRGKWAGIGRD